MHPSLLQALSLVLPVCLSPLLYLLVIYATDALVVSTLLITRQERQTEDIDISPSLISTHKDCAGTAHRIYLYETTSHHD